LHLAISSPGLEITSQFSGKRVGSPSGLNNSQTVPGQGHLSRALRFGDLFFLLLGTVIGSGIFLVPGGVLHSVGNSVPLAMGAWILGGVLSLLGALTVGELSAMIPKAGGLYVYIRDCFGPLPAFLFGWTLFFVLSTGSIAALAAAFSNYFAEFFPLNIVTAKTISVLMIAVIGVVNVRGTRASANLQNVTTIIKASALIIMAAALLWFGKAPIAHSTTMEHWNVGAYASGFGLAMISVLWAYEGWHYVTFSAGEAIHPQRDLPIAFLTGTATLVAIYVFVNFGYLAALGPEGVANSNRVAATALSLFSPIAAKLVALTILISVFSAANSVVLTASRVYYAMARDGLFFKRLAEVHPRFHTPAFSIVACTIWSAVLAASGTFEQLLTYVIFVGWMFYSLSAACVFVYRIRRPDLKRPYKVPGYPWTPAIFILAGIAMTANTIASQPTRALVGLGIVFAGAPAYFIWRARTKTQLASLPDEVQTEFSAGT
jgi:basic amino acid/polyamine antiporter, APA family